MMTIQDVLAQVPDETSDEALLAIQAVVFNPLSSSAKMWCHLTHKFILEVALSPISPGLIRISAQNREDSYTDAGGFIGQLKRQIYEIDEAIENGCYKQTPLKLVPLLARPAPPDDMDIPVWDEQTQTWYDAEY